MNTHSLFSYDFPKRSIIASATTLKKARNPQSAECKMLLRMMSEHPDFEVAEKTIQKKPGKQTYKGLTFGTMEDYIQTQDNSKKQLAVYQAVRRMAKIKGKEYALTKHWFLQSYPDYKEKAIAPAGASRTSSKRRNKCGIACERRKSLMAGGQSNA